MSEKIRWGVISTAKIGQTKVIPAMQQGQYSEICAIASRNLESVQQVANELKIDKAYGSYEELLKDPDIDAVYNPLPNHLHVEWSIKAMEAGKHVLCEKPIVLTIEELKKLIEVRNRTGMKISEAFMVRSHPQWIKTREIIQKGELGDVTAIQGFFSYFNDDAQNIRNIPEYGGGSLWDIGCYPINTSRFILNEEPLKVVATMEKDDKFGIDKLTSAILQFPSTQVLFTSATQLSPYQRMNIYGTKKHLEVEIPFNAPIDVPTKVYMNDDLSGDDKRQVMSFEICDQYTLQGDNFSKSILDDTKVPVPLEDSLNNTKVILAIFESAKTGKWVDIPKS